MFAKLRIKDIKGLFECKPLLIHKDTTIKDVVKNLIDHPINRNVYVVDDRDRLIGSIVMVQVLEKIFPEAFDTHSPFAIDIDLMNAYLAKTAGDMMHKVGDDFVNDNEYIPDVFYKMRNNRVTQLPIVDADKKVTGVFHIEHILKSWYQNSYGDRE